MFRSVFFVILDYFPGTGRQTPEQTRPGVKISVQFHPKFNLNLLSCYANSRVFWKTFIKKFIFDILCIIRSSYSIFFALLEDIHHFLADADILERKERCLLSHFNCWFNYKMQVLFAFVLFSLFLICYAIFAVSSFLDQD